MGTSPRVVASTRNTKRQSSLPMNDSFPTCQWPPSSNWYTASSPDPAITLWAMAESRVSHS